MPGVRDQKSLDELEEWLRSSEVTGTGGPTIDEIRDRFNVSLRTAHRFVSYLREDCDVIARVVNGRVCYSILG